MDPIFYNQTINYNSSNNTSPSGSFDLSAPSYPLQPTSPSSQTNFIDLQKSEPPTYNNHQSGNNGYPNLSFEQPKSPMTTSQGGFSENSSSSFDDVQRRMALMKLNQQNVKKLQEERKNQEQQRVKDEEPKPIVSTPVQTDSSTVQLSMELVNSMTDFMTKVDSKLQNLENQLRKLTLDFHQACSKEEQNTELFTQKLRILKEQLDETRSAVHVATPASKPPTQPSPTPSFSYPSISNQPSVNVNEPSIASPFIPPPYNGPSSSSPVNSSSQEDADAALAKKLQEEFDNERRQPQPQSQPQPPQLQQNFSTNTSLSSNNSSNSGARENCPVCNLSFPVGRELIEHTESHFAEPQSQPIQSHPHSQPQQPQQRVIMNTTPNGPNSNEPGFFAKIFGSKPKPQETRPVYYAPPPQQPQSQNRVYYTPPPGQVIQGQPQGQPQQIYMSSTGVPMYMPNPSTQPR